MGVIVDKRRRTLLFWDVSPGKQARGKEHGEMRTLWLQEACCEALQDSAGTRGLGFCW